MIKFVKKILIVPMIALSMTLAPVSVFAADTYYTTSRVNLRTGMGTDTNVLKTLPSGSSVAVEAYDSNGWSKVSYNGVNGFIKSEFLSTSVVEVASQKTNGAELLSWSEVKKIFKIGQDTKITDCYTGITYYVRTFSNGLHADVEPVTKEDTALLKKTYGGRWSWDPRPVLVHINGRVIAASINGMPHGGGVNANNGMDGQVCIHFKGSTTHNGNNSFAKIHQNKAVEAYNMFK